MWLLLLWIKQPIWNPNTTKGTSCTLFLVSTAHYIGVIMTTIASQITSLTIVYSTVYSDADQRKHHSSASLAFVWGIHRGPLKWPVTRKMFPFDDVIMDIFLWYRMVVCIQCILNAVSFPNVANHSTYACQARRVLNNTIVRLVTPTHFCFYLSYQIAHMVIKWKHFLRNWAFVRGIQRSPVNSPYKGQWRGALMFSFICAWINGWENRRETGDWRRHRAHYDVNVMMLCFQLTSLAHNGK